MLMTESTLLGRLLFFGALLTLVLVVGRNFLPAKTWHWMPAENLEHDIYADEIFGGVSYAERASADGIHLRCNLMQNTVGVEPFCGFNVFIDSTVTPPMVDLRSYNKMYVELEYAGGNKNLRLYIREFEVGYSDPDDPVDTAKYMSVYIPAEEADGDEIAIDMNEFTVADWWVNDNNVPRNHALPSVANVVVFGVDIAYPAALGEHELKLKRAIFVGEWISAEDWYLGILLCWVAAIFLVGGARLYQFRRLASELNRQKNQYLKLSTVDHLTDLLNRHGLSEYFEDYLGERPNDQPVAMLFIDIDHFKPINDTYGHGAGDEVLRRVAACIGRHSRQTDKAARWGGEEFLVLMPGTTADEARKVAERLRLSVERLVHPEMPAVVITVSIGVSELQPGEPFEEALERGDVALYRAKQNGRNQVICAA